MFNKLIKNTLSIIVMLSLIITIIPGFNISSEAKASLYKFETDTYGKGTLTWYDPDAQFADFTTQIKRIAHGAFDCKKLKTINLHEEVSMIESGAFSMCPQLINIEVDENNRSFSSYDGILFNKSKTKIICYPAGKTETSYTIPESVTSIGDYAFYGCDNLTEITLPAGVTEIGKSAFQNCESIRKIVLPEGVTTINDYSFSDCTKLEDITIPESVIYVENSAFANTAIYNNNKTDGIVYIDNWLIKADYNIEDVEIKEGTVGIASWAFDHCRNLKDVSIPNSVSFIGSNVFNETPIGYKADGINYVDGWIIGKGRETEVYEIAEGTKGIAPDAFYNCENLEYIKIPESVKYIGYRAFCNCTNMASITIETNDAYIGKHAFGYTTDYYDSIIGTSYLPVSGFTIECYSDSTAENYANKCRFDCKTLDSISQNSEDNIKEDSLIMSADEKQDIINNDDKTENTVINDSQKESDTDAPTTPIVPIAITSTLVVGGVAAFIFYKNKAK